MTCLYPDPGSVRFLRKIVADEMTAFGVKSPARLQKISREVPVLNTAKGVKLSTEDNELIETVVANPLIYLPNNVFYLPQIRRDFYWTVSVGRSEYGSALPSCACWHSVGRRLAFARAEFKELGLPDTAKPASYDAGCIW